MSMRGKGHHPSSQNPGKGFRVQLLLRWEGAGLSDPWNRLSTRQVWHNAEVCHPCRVCHRRRATHSIKFLSFCHERQDSPSEIMTWGSWVVTTAQEQWLEIMTKTWALSGDLWPIIAYDLWRELREKDPRQKSKVTKGSEQGYVVSTSAGKLPMSLTSEPLIPLKCIYYILRRKNVSRN
jgi:NAD-dependent dihydropyrimidine dehydrogenase PreA subunit